ncbi:MAG: UbiA family prenyltransferase [Ferruginibacter sp.]
MKLLTAFFRLIRWPNLVFIVVTQFLFYYFIIIPSLPNTYYHLNNKLTYPLFLWLVVASILIAAAGYIINDYFDINIDLVNKPDKMVVERIISRRWAIALHFILSTIGVVISLYVSLKSSPIIIVGNIACLWAILHVHFCCGFIQTTFKKKIIIRQYYYRCVNCMDCFGNLFCNQYYVFRYNANDHEIFSAMRHIYKLAALYAGLGPLFASLIREAIKDI